MAFLEAHSERPLPTKGFMVLSGSVKLRGQPCVDIASGFYLLETMLKMIPLNEWLVLTVWEHAYFIETWKPMGNKAEAKAYSRKHGFRTIYNCNTNLVEFVDLAWG